MGSGAGEVKGMALLGRGLHEFEALHEDNQTTLALTLLRSVGWLSRGDLRTRTGHVAPMLAVPNAQLYERELTADYALMPLMQDDPAALLRAGRGFSIPLQAYQYNTAPETRQQSYLRTEGDVILSALKPPQRGDGWIVRFFNPGIQAVEARLHPHTKPQTAHRVTLAEDKPDVLVIGEDGVVIVRAEPQQIVTVRLGFGD
jgi:alpha-mannosidase